MDTPSPWHGERPDRGAPGKCESLAVLNEQVPCASPGKTRPGTGEAPPTFKALSHPAQAALVELGSSALLDLRLLQLPEHAPADAPAELTSQLNQKKFV